MMLEAIPGGVKIGVTAKVRKDQKRRPVLVPRITLDEIPNFSAKAIRTTYTDQAVIETEDGAENGSGIDLLAMPMRGAQFALG